MEELATTLGDSRLVTLIGPGGVGKSRVAIAGAACVLDGLDRGARLVELGGVADGRLVPTTIATALSIPERSGDPFRSIADRVGSASMLLLLDTCEHLRDAIGGVVATLLAACPRLVVLATSRAPLEVRGEAIIDVPGLEPAAAAELFVRRARSRVRSFQVPCGVDRDAVASICRRLDCLPLAIEMAAMWVDVLPVAAIDERLAERFTFLTRAAHDMPARQATLRAALDWSFDLLDADERRIFETAGVFPGRFDLSTLAAVAGEPADDVALRLSSLSANSLVQAAGPARDNGTAFVMLDTTRAYARDRLCAAGGFDEAMERLAGALTARATQFGEQFTSGSVGEARDEVRENLHSYRTCLSWLAEQERWDEFLVIATGVWHYFNAIGAGSEARHWLEMGVDDGHRPPAFSALKALALSFLGDTRRRQGGVADASACEERSIELFTEVGEEVGAAWARTVLAGVRTAQGDLAASEELLRAALTVFRANDKLAQASYAISNLGHVADRAGDRAEAERLQHEALEIGRGLGNAQRICFPLTNLGLCALRDGDARAARPFFEEALTTAEAADAKVFVAISYLGLAHCALVGGRRHEADRLAQRAAELHADIDYLDGEAATLALLGTLARLRGELGTAAAFQRRALLARRTCSDAVAVGQSLAAIARLAIEAAELQKAAAWLAAAGPTGMRATFPVFEDDRETLTAIRRAGLPVTGDELPIEAAVDDALAWCEALAANRDDSAHARGDTSSEPLTARQQEVLALAGEGLSDKQIAAALGISEKTVGRHLAAVYRKLGARNRMHAVRLAAGRAANS